jgi:hypothetical protein
MTIEPAPVHAMAIGERDFDESSRRHGLHRQKGRRGTDNAFGVEEAGSKVFVIAGSPHGDSHGLDRADTARGFNETYFQRLLDGYVIL